MTENAGGQKPRHNRVRRRLTGQLVASGLVALAVLAAATFVLWRSGDDARVSCDRGRRACPPASAEPAVADAAQASAAAHLGAAAAPSASASASAARSGPPSKPAAPPRPGGAGAVGAGFPGAGNTGPRVKSFTRHDGNTSIKDDGAVISGWDLHGSLDVYANNVTVTDCRITSSNWWGVNLRPGFTGLHVTHCAITGVPGAGPDHGGEDYAVSNMSDGSIEIGWSNISQFGNALSMGHGNIHDNYVHDLSAFINQSGGWQHVDALISNGGDTGGLVIRHNTLLNQTHAEQGASAALGLFADTGSVSNTTVDGNWLAGGAYALYAGGNGSTNIKVTNNVFSTQFWPGCGIYGPVAYWNPGGAGNVWSGNVTSDGKPVNP
jgi:hypothetical protein